jgi:hypothetical protein
MADSDRGQWTAFGGAVLVGTIAVAAGWYASARNGLSVNSTHELIPARASAADPFLLVMYGFMVIGLYITVAGLSGRGWLPGASLAEERARRAAERKETVLHALSMAEYWAHEMLTRDTQVPMADVRQWMRVTYDLIDKALGPQDAILFLSPVGIQTIETDAGRNGLAMRMAVIGDITRRWSMVTILDGFVPGQWAGWEEFDTGARKSFPRPSPSPRQESKQTIASCGRPCYTLQDPGCREDRKV